MNDCAAATGVAGADHFAVLREDGVDPRAVVHNCYVRGDRLAWLGWPPGEARLSDCLLVEKDLGPRGHTEDAREEEEVVG